MSMSQGDENGMMSEINVTPFVDVMLVLLIIFMVFSVLLIVMLLRIFSCSKEVSLLSTVEEFHLLWI